MFLGRYTMKKLITISIAILLLLGTIGPGLNFHYCGGHLAGFSLYHSAKPCCSGHCPSCKNVVVFYKLKDNFEKQTINIPAHFAPVYVLLNLNNSPDLFSSCSVSAIKCTQIPYDYRSSRCFTGVFLI
jgi:hypothetical protein